MSVDLVCCRCFCDMTLKGEIREGPFRIANSVIYQAELGDKSSWLTVIEVFVITYPIDQINE